MTTAAAPQLESDRESPPQSHRDLKLVHTTRREPDAHSLDGTQGQQIGSRPYDDATQGVRIGSYVYDDAPRAVSRLPVAGSGRTATPRTRCTTHRCRA